MNPFILENLWPRLTHILLQPASTSRTYLAIVELVVCSKAKLPWHHVSAYEPTLTHCVGSPAATVHTHDTHACQHVHELLYAFWSYFLSFYTQRVLTISKGNIQDKFMNDKDHTRKHCTTAMPHFKVCSLKTAESSTGLHFSLSNEFLGGEFLNAVIHKMIVIVGKLS